MPNTSRLSAAPVLGLTATRAVLLPAGSDRALRKLIADLFTVANRMEELRRRFGSKIGLSGPQFSMMMAIAELQGSNGVSVTKLADYQHVVPAFVTAEVGKLIRKGYITKNPDPTDGRVSRLRIARAGASALRSLMPLVRQVNDQLWGLESAEQFASVCGAIARIVETSARAVAIAGLPNGVVQVRPIRRVAP